MSCFVPAMPGGAGGGTLLFDDHEIVSNGRFLLRSDLSIDISSYTFLEFYMKYDYRGPFLAYGKVLCSTILSTQAANYNVLGRIDLNGSSTGYELYTNITINSGILTKVQMRCLSGYDSSGTGTGDARLTIYGL